jgi:hypothetical protein
MHWPWNKRERTPADEALAEARAERKVAHERGREITVLVDRLREIRAANHFAENIRRALGEQ